MIIGICGKMGVGKSTIANYIATILPNTEIISCDRLFKESVEHHFVYERAILDIFGSEDAVKDRKQLLALMVYFPNKAKQLNLVSAQIAYSAILNILSKKEFKGNYIIESSFLLQVPLKYICDNIIYVYCNEKARQDRIFSRDSNKDEFTVKLLNDLTNTTSVYNNEFNGKIMLIDSGNEWHNSIKKEFEDNQ